MAEVCIRQSIFLVQQWFRVDIVLSELKRRLTRTRHFDILKAYMRHSVDLYTQALLVYRVGACADGLQQCRSAVTVPTSISRSRIHWKLPTFVRPESRDQSGRQAALRRRSVADFSCSRSSFRNCRCTALSAAGCSSGAVTSAKQTTNVLRQARKCIRSMTSLLITGGGGIFSGEPFSWICRREYSAGPKGGAILSGRWNSHLGWKLRINLDKIWTYFDKNMSIFLFNNQQQSKKQWLEVNFSVAGWVVRTLRPFGYMGTSCYTKCISHEIYRVL